MDIQKIDKYFNSLADSSIIANEMKNANLDENIVNAIKKYSSKVAEASMQIDQDYEAIICSAIIMGWLLKTHVNNVITKE